MEYTREIYWNVGHGVLVPMYALAVLAVGAAAWGCWQRVQVYRQGKAVHRTDGSGARLLHLLYGVLLQAKVLRVPGAGTAHGLFFWGFAVLAAGTALVFLQADLTAPLFGITFLTGPFYLLFSLALDLAGGMALLMLGALFVRRYLVKPAGLVTKRDDALMHALLFALLLSGFLLEGARMAATELGTPLAPWSPIGWVVAHALAPLDEKTLRQLHGGTWWGHLVLTCALIVSVPFSKFRHLLTTPANYFLADRRPKGALVTLDLEDEGAESFGARKVADLNWKDLLDADACTGCKRCQDRCPAHATGKPLSPMQVIERIGEAAFDDPAADLAETISRDALWSCTTCRACQEICPAAVEHVPKVVEMRRRLVLMEGEFPGEEVMTAMENLEVNGNPLGLGYAGRGDWAQTMGVKTLAEDPQVDVLYFVGCYASFDKRNVAVARSFVRLCQAAGVKVGILGKEEKCCGEPARKLGNEYLYQTLAKENIAAIQGFGVKRVVTACPHCFHTLGRDYRDLGFDLPVEHHTVFLQRLLADGKLKLKAETFACTFHDSCYLGRYHDVFAAPRTLLRAAGGKVAEMAKSGAESFCCGAGGGRILAEEKLGSRINVERAKQAAGTGAPVLAANCPFCLTMFEDGIKGAELEGQLVPRDIAEILAERIAAS